LTPVGRAAGDGAKGRAADEIFGQADVTTPSGLPWRLRRAGSQHRFINEPA
jgi:hypothetical protein